MTVETTHRDRERTAGMERVTFRATDANLGTLESLVDAGRYPNRSEAIRAAIRQLGECETDCCDAD